MRKEKFSIGDKVFLIHLKEQGIISRIINDELMYVELDGMEIPVFSNDVSRGIEEEKIEKTDHEKISVSDEKRPAPDKSDQSNPGIFISFEPVKSRDEISSFNIFIVNNTEFPIDFSYYFLMHDEIDFALKKLLEPFNYMLLHSIEYDLLNEVPAVQLEVRGVMNQNFTAKLDQKIKPQNFFNKLATTPILHKETYQYKISTQSLQKKSETKKKPIAFDADVLKQMMMEIPVIKDKEVESPVEEIDLHIEVLAKDYEMMSASEKLNVQLSKFQQALERAIAHHSERLYAIHGVGSGKLKNEIHRILKSYKEVRSFNNDFHSRYGYGATEIILR